MKTKLIGVRASKLVILALHDLEVNSGKDEGVTLHDITKYISEKYNVGYKKIKPSIHAVLVRGVSYGIFSKKNCRYKLEDVPEPPLMNDSKKKNEKLAAAIVERIKTGIRKRRLSKSGVGGKVKPLVVKGDDNYCQDCQQWAKRRKVPTKSDAAKSVRK